MTRPLPPAIDEGWHGLAITLCELAFRAGVLIEALSGGAIDINLKQDGSPATEADVCAEDLITQGLRAAYPTTPIIAEESANVRAPGPVTGTFFLVDPLDGTREFLKGNGNYTVNIALIDEHVPIAGVVYAPAHGRLFVTLEPGATVELAVKTTDRPDFTRLIETAHRLDAVRHADGRVRALVSESHGDAKIEAFLEETGCERIAIGSSFKFCMIATGEADLYPRFGPTNAWDTAAGQAILEQAGGSVWALGGDRLSYGRAADTPGGFTLKNPGFIAHGSPERPAEKAIAERFM